MASECYVINLGKGDIRITICLNLNTSPCSPTKGGEGGGQIGIFDCVMLGWHLIVPKWEFYAYKAKILLIQMSGTNTWQQVKLHQHYS